MLSKETSRMKKRTTLTAVIVAALALAAAPFVIAGPGHGAGMGNHGPGMAMHGGPGMGMHGGEGFAILGHLRHAKEELGLTDQQTEQIKTIFTELHDQNSAYREQMHGGLRGAAEILLANPSDIAGAQALLDQQAAVERTMKTNMLNATAKAFGVLTADQRAKLRAMMAEHSERRERRGR
jgi:Spy/CpxP family protein refolding chaperone